MDDDLNPKTREQLVEEARRPQFLEGCIRGCPTQEPVADEGDTDAQP